MDIMNDLFKKLNVLVKAGINDLLGEDTSSTRPRRRSLTPAQLGKDIDKEVQALRERINDALAYEDELQARVKTISDEVARWDKQADEAVVAGNDSLARYAIDRMKNAQKRLAMADSDLHEHRMVTQELIQRVNMLEAVVADAHRAQAQQAQADETVEQTEGRTLADVLQDARQKIIGMRGTIETDQQLEATPDEPADDQTVEDDLAHRRERLSKPR